MIDPKNKHRNARGRGKRWELEVAKALGTKRTGPTGLNDPDVIHDTLAVECKALGRLALRSDHLEQAIRNAKGRQWVLAIKEYRTGRRVVVIDFDHFIALQSNMEAQ